MISTLVAIVESSLGLILWHEPLLKSDVVAQVVEVRSVANDRLRKSDGRSLVQTTQGLRKIAQLLVHQRSLEPNLGIIGGESQSCLERVQSCFLVLQHCAADCQDAKYIRVLR